MKHKFANLPPLSPRDALYKLQKAGVTGLTGYLSTEEGATFRIVTIEADEDQYAAIEAALASGEEDGGWRLRLEDYLPFEPEDVTAHNFKTGLTIKLHVEDFVENSELRRRDYYSPSDTELTSPVLTEDFTYIYDLAVIPVGPIQKVRVITWWTRDGDAGAQKTLTESYNWQQAQAAGQKRRQKTLDTLMAEISQSMFAASGDEGLDTSRDPLVNFKLEIDNWLRGSGAGLYNAIRDDTEELLFYANVPGQPFTVRQYLLAKLDPWKDG